MTECSEYVLETLAESGERTLYRGRRRGDPLLVLLVATGLLLAIAHGMGVTRRMNHFDDPSLQIWFVIAAFGALLIAIGIKHRKNLGRDQDAR